jgi:hypothetical protein
VKRLAARVVMFVGVVALLNALAVFANDPVYRLLGAIELVCGIVLLVLGWRGLSKA